VADSNITKKALAASLKELMQKKSLTHISVSDICEGCDMNRKSFYYHFRDKYDLVNWIFDSEFIRVMNLSSTINVSEHIEGLENLVYYFYNNRQFYKKALTVDGQNSFSEHFHELAFTTISVRMKEMFPDDEISDFQINFFSDAIVSSLKRWITEKECISPEEFMRQLNNCLKYISLRYNQL